MKTELKPYALFDFLIKESGLKNDAALARALEITAPTISKIRGGKNRVTAEIILSIYKQTGLSIETIEELINKGSK